MKDNHGSDNLKNHKGKKLIKDIDLDLQSYVFPGKPLTDDEFRALVEYAETTPTISLREAKKRWEVKKRELLNL